MKTRASFTVREGESVPFTLSYHPSHQQPHFVPDRRESMERTAIWWREWVKRGSFGDMPEAWRDAVVRSLITLKMLTYRADGRHRRGADRPRCPRRSAAAGTGITGSAGSAIPR